ncbi:MAG TPA: hypothetical protein VFM18_23610 [Methanosarcina sp.]|nr:hypothetical protein [Methanosarcina sp.]
MTYRTFSQVVSDAIDDLETHGFDSIDRLEKWQREIEYAAEREVKAKHFIDAKLKEHLSRIYASRIERGGILKSHDIPRWTLEQIKPKLRNELDRRIMASAQLIKLNREEMINKTIRRFSGWATSLPMGGSAAVSNREIAEDIKKGIKSLPFEQRRVMIDQAHKLKASIDNIVATDGGAIAAEWTIRETSGYENRPDHVKRKGEVYLMPESWALKQGLIKPAGHKYTTDIDQPGEKISCSCVFKYLYNLRSMPHECLTEKGREALAK